MRVLILVLVMLIGTAASAQETETPTPAPTETLIPSETPTPTPDLVVYATVQVSDEPGQATAFIYQMDAGQLVTNTLLFGILLSNLMQLVITLWRGSRWNK